MWNQGFREMLCWKLWEAGIPCLPSEEHVMRSAGRHSAISTCSKAEVYIPRERLLPSALCGFAATEDLAVGTVYLEMGHLSTSKETEKLFLRVHSVGTRQPCWSLPRRVWRSRLEADDCIFLCKYHMSLNFLCWLKSFSIWTFSIQGTNERQESNDVAWELYLLPPE